MTRRHTAVGIILVQLACVCPAIAQTQAAAKPGEQPVPHLDDWQWAIRLGVGAIAPVTGKGTTDQGSVELGSGASFTVDIVRALRCELEVFGSGVLVLRETMSVLGAGSAAADAHIAPTGVQLGFVAKSCERPGGDFYAGPLVSGFGRDRSDEIRVGTQSSVVRVPGSWGVGAIFGYRKVLSESPHAGPERGSTPGLDLDVNVRWQRIRLLLGDNGRASWNPLQITAGVLLKF